MTTEALTLMLMIAAGVVVFAGIIIFSAIQAWERGRRKRQAREILARAVTRFYQG